MTDLCAKGAAQSELYAVDGVYMRETSFAHMARLTTEAMASDTNNRTASHIKRRRGYRPPMGRRLRKELRHERKALAGRYCQLLSGHAAIGAFLCSRLNKIPSDRCQ